MAQVIHNLRKASFNYFRVKWGNRESKNNERIKLNSFLFSVLVVEPRVSFMLGKQSTTELQS